MKSFKGFRFYQHLMLACFVGFKLNFPNQKKRHFERLFCLIYFFILIIFTFRDSTKSPSVATLARCSKTSGLECISVSYFILFLLKRNDTKSLKQLKYISTSIKWNNSLRTARFDFSIINNWQKIYLKKNLWKSCFPKRPLVVMNNRLLMIS